MSIGPAPVITTGRVVLRSWRPDDAQLLTAIYGDPLSAQYIEVPQPYDLGQATAFVHRAARSRTAGTAFHYAVTLPGTGDVVGSAYLHACDPAETTTEVSYLIHPHHRGRGLATAALAGLSDAALAGGFRQVLARIAPANVASESAARNAGFRLLRPGAEENWWHRDCSAGAV